MHSFAADGALSVMRAMVPVRPDRGQETHYARRRVDNSVGSGNHRRMASFIFIYRAGPEPVPADRVAENRAAWRAWNAALQEDYGIRTSHGKRVTSAGVSDYDGDVRGASMVEFASMDAAVEAAMKSPNLAFGGSVEVLAEHEAPR